MPSGICSKHAGATGLIDEFSFMSEVEKDYPLHGIVFQQTSASMPGEHKSEETFSLSKGLADASMDISFLQTLTKLKGFSDQRKPSIDRIWERYCDMFHKGKTHAQADIDEVAAITAMLNVEEDSPVVCD